MNSEILRCAGVDFDKGVARFLGDRCLYESILTTFLKDTTFAQGKAALEGENYQYLHTAVHTIKGVAGNMDMAALFLTAAVLCEYLRKHEPPEKTVVTDLFCVMETAYLAVISAIIAAREV